MYHRTQKTGIITREWTEVSTWVNTGMKSGYIPWLDTGVSACIPADSSLSLLLMVQKIFLPAECGMMSPKAKEPYKSEYY